MATPLMSLPDQSQGKRKYVVPWKSRKEFLKIYHDIYSEDEILHLKAIKRITTWKSRAGSKLSVAVENTGRLFESILNHKTALKEHCVHEKEDSLRASYGVAIIRFVNFVTERAQTKAVAQPVHVVAKQFGIPEWIVRIRHDATHNVFPSLDMLSTAACWAVQYLKEEFWKCQSHDYNLPVSKRHQLKHTKPVGEIRHTIQTFKKLRFEEMSSAEYEQKKTVVEMKELKHCLNDNRFGFMSCLLECGSLIPLAHELEAFGSQQEELMNQPSPCLPARLSEFWHPLLNMLKSTESIGTFAKVAMFSMTDTDCLRNHLIACWLDFILKGATQAPGSTDGLVFDKSSLPMKDLLYTCLDNANKFTFHLIKYLLHREELGDDAYTKLSDLVRVALPSVSIDEAGEEEEKSVYSVQDVKEASFSNVRDSNPHPPPSLGDAPTGASGDDIGWKICTDVVDWSSVPLGIIPSQEEEEPVEEEEEGDDAEDVDDDNDDEVVDNDDDEDDEDDRQIRDWKQLGRKRSFDEDDTGINEKRSSPKRSTYTVNDTELL